MKSMKTLTLTASLIAFSANAYAQDNAETDTADLETMVQEMLQPEWRICNETSFSLRVATVTTVDGVLRPKGWDKLSAGSCLDKDVPAQTPRFVYAESSPAHRGGIREWKGKSEFCADDQDFEAESGKSCALQNLSTRAFLAVDPNENVTTLVEIEDFKKNAATAGIQRLLQDNGYEITRIDGVAGRRTQRTLDTFIKDNELPANLSAEGQLAELEKAALSKLPNVGLTVCNKSSANIWTAMGRRRKGNWESRGWWEILPDDCAQLFSDSLIDADISYFAIQDTIDPQNNPVERSLRSISTKPSQFCISDSMFSVLGREGCSDLGYKPANFRTLPLDKDGIMIELTDTDFADPAPAGLRQ